MKRKNWTRGMIVLGIALLVAAVALMPACESGDSVDACESLTGDWELTLTLDNPEDLCESWYEDFHPPVEEVVLAATIKIIGSRITILTSEGTNLEIHPENPPTEIACDGRQFQISYWDTTDVPCVGATQKFSFSGAFTNADTFEATAVVDEYYPADYPNPGDPEEICDFSYTVVGKRK